MDVRNYSMATSEEFPPIRGRSKCCRHLLDYQLPNKPHIKSGSAGPALLGKTAIMLNSRAKFCIMLLGLTFSPAAVADARSGNIALTFDDLPALTLLHDQPYVNYLNETLVRGLRRHHLPATGFVNEGKLNDIDRAQQIAVLKKWLDAGMDIGNHTFFARIPQST